MVEAIDRFFGNIRAVLCLRVRLIVLEHGEDLIVGFSTINHAEVADGAGTKDTVAVTERWGFLGRLTVT